MTHSFREFSPKAPDLRHVVRTLEVGVVVPFFTFDQEAERKGHTGRRQGPVLLIGPCLLPFTTSL